MTRAIEVVGRGGWAGQAADSVVLGLEDRRRRQGALKGVRGLEIELALADALTLRTGDALKLEDGRFVEVVAAPEALVELRCADAQELARVAWHFGNRHVPIQILGQKLRLRDDADLAPVIAHLGLKATPIEAPFDPEGGAYAAETVVEEAHGHACGCGGHHHDHDHDDAHDHGHAHHHHGHDGCCGGKGHGETAAAGPAAGAKDHDHAHDHAGGCCGGHGHHHGRHHGHGHHGHGHGGCGCGGKG